MEVGGKTSLAGLLKLVLSASELGLAMMVTYLIFPRINYNYGAGLRYLKYGFCNSFVICFLVL